MIRNFALILNKLKIVFFFNKNLSCLIDVLLLLSHTKKKKTRRSQFHDKINQNKHLFSKRLNRVFIIPLTTIDDEVNFTFIYYATNNYRW